MGQNLVFHVFYCKTLQLFLENSLKTFRTHVATYRRSHGFYETAIRERKIDRETLRQQLHDCTITYQRLQNAILAGIDSALTMMANSLLIEKFTVIKNTCCEWCALELHNADEKSLATRPVNKARFENDLPGGV